MPDLAMNPAWARRGPWSGILSAGPLGAPGQAGVTVTARDGLGIASLIVGEGRAPDLAEAVRARFGLELPAAPRAIHSAEHALVWAGPAQWLLVAEDRRSFADDLAALSGLAAVADQSDGRAALRVAGPQVRDMLAKGCMLDLHPSVFPPGAAALTSIAYVGVHLWRIDTGRDGDDMAFEMVVPRSMAGSFWSWASASAAEFGCAVALNGRG